VADEIQSGLGRTGKMLACEHENVRPDILVLGKALSGGVYPVSAVLADDVVMLCIQWGEHGSTYGGNPMASAVATAALEVLQEEKLPERAEQLGVAFREQLQPLVKQYDWLSDVRGKGLFNAVEIKEDSKVTAWEICVHLLQLGVMAKPTHDTTIRFTPPLMISEELLLKGCQAIKEALAWAEERNEKRRKLKNL